jgi:outer membrane protein assembly factor BamB
VVVDGIVYVGDVDGGFYAYQLSDGQEVWKQKIEGSGFLSGAAYHDGRLYVGDFNGVIRALDAKDGKELWQFEAKGEAYASPNVVAQQVLVTTEAGELISLDATTGKENWHFQIEAPLRCWPTVVDGRVLLAGCDERVHAVDVATGKEVAGVDIDGPTGATPAMLNGHALFGTEQGSFYSINSENMEIVWRHLDAENIDAIHTAAAVDSRVAIYGTQGKLAYALKPATGEVAWKFPVRSHVESSPVIAGDSAFLATKRGMIHRVDVNTGKELWNYEAGGDFQASFAIADGKLVIGNTDGTLYCFGKK